MKKFMKVVTASAFALSLATVSSMAGNGLPSGAHFQFNLIGHPGNVDVLKNDESNGRAIMVPLSNTKSTEAISCNGEIVVTDDTEATWSSTIPKGAKINFIGGDHYEIIDRDATDKDGAEVMLKTTTNAEGDTVRDFDVYVRVLGKPNQCMNMGAYAYDETALDGTSGLWFWAGSVDLGRKAGKPVSKSLNDLFEVHYCEVETVIVDDTEVEQCTKGTEEEISVFDNVFEEYVWNIINDGTRNVQVRFYPKDAAVK